MVQPLWKTIWRFLKKLNIELPYDPAIALLGICPKELKAGTQRDIHTHVFSSIIPSSQKVEGTHVSVDNWMDKQNVVHAYNKILFSLKKEGNSDTGYNMDKPAEGPGSGPGWGTKIPQAAQPKKKW